MYKCRCCCAKLTGVISTCSKVNLTQDVHEDTDTSLSGSYREQEIRFTSALKCTQLEYNRQEGNCAVAFGWSTLIYFFRVSRPQLQ